MASFDGAHNADARDRDDRRRPVDVAVGAERRDQVRWGPLWAGVLVILPTVLVLHLAALALGLMDLGGGAGSNATWVSAVIGFIGFLVGGLVAGATAMWRGVGTGLLHGLLVWTLGVVLVLLLTLLGGGALLGSLSGVLSQVANLQQLSPPDIQASEALQTARSAAGGAVLGMLASLIAAMIGGAVGATMWGKDQDRVTTAR